MPEPTANTSTIDLPSDSESTWSLVESIPSISETPKQTNVLPKPSTPRSPKDFVLDLIGLMGTSPGKCGVEAQNSPQVKWTCAEYTKGLSDFITDWDDHIASAEVALKHSYSATSGWMYFEIDGEVDFFWKTYDLQSTQALVTYNPSESGNELIIGLNPVIGNRIAAADGSHDFISNSQVFQE